jgi:hypothetical protein
VGFKTRGTTKEDITKRKRAIGRPYNSKRYNGEKGSPTKLFTL